MPTGKRRAMSCEVTCNFRLP